MKIEFLGHYHAQHGYPLRDRLFGNIHNISKISSLVKPVSNILADNNLSKLILSQIGISSERSLPSLSKKSFTNWFKNRAQPADRKTNKKIIYFHDTWVSYHIPEIGKSAVKLLEEAGFEVMLVENRVCCGRPMLSKGMINQARDLAMKNVSVLTPYLKQNITVVGTEPSCILTFRDEYLDLLPDSIDAQTLSESSFLLDELLYTLHESDKLGINWKNEGPDVFYHGHCHQRSLIGNRASMELLKLSGCNARESGAGCCGMAGSFGYEAEHFGVSKAIAEDRLLPGVRETAPETVIAVSGISCRHQIEDFSDRKPKHIAEVLADQIR